MQLLRVANWPLLLATAWSAAASATCPDLPLIRYQADPAAAHAAGCDCGYVLRSDSGSDARLVATALSINSEWSMNRHVSFTAIYTHFSPRGFLEQTGPAAALEFLELTGRVRF